MGEMWFACESIGLKISEIICLVPSLGFSFQFLTHRSFQILYKWSTSDPFTTSVSAGPRHLCYGCVSARREGAALCDGDNCESTGSHLSIWYRGKEKQDLYTENVVSVSKQKPCILFHDVRQSRWLGQDLEKTGDLLSGKGLSCSTWIVSPSLFLGQLGAFPLTPLLSPSLALPLSCSALGKSLCPGVTIRAGLQASGQTAIPLFSCPSTPSMTEEKVACLCLPATENEANGRVILRGCWNPQMKYPRA